MIYMDNAATTRVDEAVFDAMVPFLKENYGNASSVYQFGVKVRNAVDNARKECAALIGASQDEIYFTGGGSEADNWVLEAVCDVMVGKGKHIITTKIEHHAVLHTSQYLEQKGYEVTYVDVDEYGLVDVEKIRKAIRPDTILISVMFANNEIGTIEPIAAIGRLAHEKGILFHTDAVQAYGHVPIDVKAMNIDYLSASGHKINGPKGVGILYASKNAPIFPFIHGGGQERAKRAGTHNSAGIVGMGVASRLANNRLKTEENSAVLKMRDYLIGRVLSEIPFTKLNGHPEKRLANNANFSFDYVEGESLLIMLDMNGICVSSGSACTAGSLEPSHVLKAIGLSDAKAKGSIRITLSKDNTKEEVDFVVETLKKSIERLRSMNKQYLELSKNSNF